SSRTAGPRLSPRRCAAAVPSWSRPGSSPTTTSSRRSTWPTQPLPDPTHERTDTMPRLLRGVARTAVIAGTATAVSNRVSRRQANRWSQQQEPQPQEQQYAEPPPEPAPPPAAPAPDRFTQLKEL